MTRTWWGSDAAGLLIVGLATIARGVSYMPGLVITDRPAAHYLEGVFPPTVWGAVWIAIGLACIAAMVVPRIMPACVGLAVGVHASWGASFLAAQFFDERLPRPWVTALSYFLICALILWAFGRGRATEVRIDEEA